MRLALFFSLLLSPFLIQSQVCQPSANCARGDFIDDFDFGSGLISNQNTRGTNCGFPWNPGASYWNTNISASITEDSSYTFTVASGNRAQYYAIWVDWNRDLDFNDAGEFVYSTQIALVSASGTIFSPRGIKPGNATMRVRSRRSSSFSSTDACSTVSFGETEDYTLIQSIRYAPIANFATGSTNSGINCPIQFENTSTGYGASFSWNFGDGNSSTMENPSHSYSSQGNYTVSLTVTNSIGSDSETKTNYMSISAAGGPVNANCTPSGSASVAGFGITQFDIAGSSYSSADAQSSGYEDLSCNSIGLIQGQTYLVSLKGTAAAQQNYRIWIDWNGDGFLSNNNELVLNVNNQTVGTGSITVPQTAILNTPLRIRISGVYSLTAPLNNNFDACTNLNNGQIEDRSLIISPNTNAPIANFDSDIQNSCDGIVNFQDKSSFVPTAWSWDFGDNSTSNQQNPQHTYSSNGSYTVKLTVTNSFGSNSVTKFNFINVNGNNLSKSACQVGTQSHISDYGIYSVSLNTMSNSSAGGEVGYEDFSCEKNTTLLKQQPYALEVRTGTNNNEDVKVWIDLNDDGSFGSNELLMTSLNNSFHVDSITIPSNAVTGKALRMRISSDFVGANVGPCADVTFGQVEDYSVNISNNPNAIVADFASDSTISCTGNIQFSDLSSNNPNSWLWNFGDGTTSSQQNPSHTYSSAGSYTVRLVAFKSGVSDTSTKANYIVVDPQVCSSTNIPGNSTGVDLSSCAGRIFDSGGKSDYAANTFGRISITPSNSSSVELIFNSFSFASGDYLKIFNGPDTNSPLIGLYTGTSLSSGSKIIGSSGSLTLVQYSDGSAESTGFDAQWVCSKNPSKPTAIFSADSVESCKGFVNFIDLSVDQPSSWFWDFGDGANSTQKNPLHFYPQQGKYTVSLIVSNSLGSDTLTKNLFIHVNKGFCAPEGIEVWESKGGMKLYPNPSNGRVNLELSNIRGAKLIEVIDLAGRSYLKESYSSNEGNRIVLNLHELPTGIYLIRLQSENFLGVQKLNIE